jgi:hypothetical protein
MWPPRGTDIKIFEVQTAGTGDGIYNCFELQLVKMNWAGTGVDKFQPKDETPVIVEILNLAESGGAGTALVVEDRLAAWQRTDDEGTKRWVGIPFEITAGETSSAGVKIYEIVSNATGSGVYNCKKQKIIDTNWEGSAVDHFEDDGTGTTEILNLYENYSTESSHNLSVADRLAVWQINNDAIANIASIDRASGTVIATLESVDDFETGKSVIIADVADDSFNGTFIITNVDTENDQITYEQAGDDATSDGGTATSKGAIGKWVGIPIEEPTGIHTAYVAEDAGESNHITCFLDHDGTDPAAWEHKVWAKDDTLVGDDAQIYYCIIGYEATDDTTRPITGTNWAAYWAVIQQIEVYCDISGGGDLRDADRHLLTMHKTIGYSQITNPPVEWTAGIYSGGEYIWGTSHKGIFFCILGHTGTEDNRPTYGDFETYWEIAKQFADKLKIAKMNGVWETTEGFEASDEDASNNA